jgi:zinc/manganese transport system substrate-binding protein
LRAAAVLGPLMVAWVVAGCSASGGSGDAMAGAAPSGAQRSGEGSIRIVASTNVYGDIAQRIAGGTAQVTSLISDPAQDPHSFEASPQALVALSKADIVIENGGGYDDFVDSLLKTADADPVVLNVVDISGFAAQQGEALNEHVWYDLPTMARFVDELAAALSKADPAGVAGFTVNASAFKGELTRMRGEQGKIKAAHGGTGAAVTEPVPLYLLTAAGLINKTPPEFSEAIEADTDVSPAVLQQTLNLLQDKQVALLAYNEQTTGPQTQQVQAAAAANGIPVVGFTELLPAGKDYLSWMNDNLTALAAALDAGAAVVSGRAGS